MITTTSSLLSQRALQRARQAMACLPFTWRFYQVLEEEALSSTALLERSDRTQFCQQPLTASRIEDDFIWLIQLGVLRREVDGQGLTERVRLTPMGRECLRCWTGAIPRASLPQRLHHWLRRYRPRL
ncbi:winged helix-turn-helix DNA-binding domain-containing protein [Synechococcus sp. RS9909]|uniref:Npun_F0494 family protein n=1 Tax=unclassified Synechococcus TaxID=2626047 RepID=UPI000068FCCA|nr:hypothetical protein RS9917_01676 [Synechococcus sp. RS9917]QNI78834.1 winged helix-turn-helix DNA-binding domain-containing protein [Synechococcus sp. RS9909]